LNLVVAEDEVVRLEVACLRQSIVFISIMGAALIIKDVNYLLLVCHKTLQIMHELHNNMSFFWDTHRFVDCMIQWGL
jgi:hypothetical protein